jgi:hypothetical protein
MADLTQANAELSIKNGENALKFSHQMTAEQLKNVYKFLVAGYRNKRQMAKAREYFEKLKAMQ